MEIASCGLYLQPMTNGALEEKFVREFFCPYFIVSLHAITEHGEVVLKGVFAANLLPDGINRVPRVCGKWLTWSGLCKLMY